MMSTNFTTNPTFPDTFFVSGTNPFVPRNRITGEDARSLLSRLVKEIECSNTRLIVDRVFSDLLRLLECLTLIERHLRHVHKAEATLLFFQLIHDDARRLVDFIREEAVASSNLAPDVVDTLDGISFALSHDLRRVFEAETTETNPSSSMLGQVHRAHDVLTNCLQQSTVALAIVFDSTLVGARLFNNSDIRYRQSLQLCQDLLTLRHLVECFEETHTPAAMSELMEGLEQFRAESMECLMYSDWPQFESFCERIAVAADDANSLSSVLHQFSCYLEALLGQVRMRAVLVESPTQDYANSVNAPLSLLNSQTEEVAWDALALA